MFVKDSVVETNFNTLSMLSRIAAFETMVKKWDVEDDVQGVT